MVTSDELFEVLKGEDDLGVVIRTHIHIEASINNLLDNIFEQPEYINEMRISYHQKVKLALACGMDPRFEKPLNTLGTMRNRFAHRLEARLGKAEVDSLYSSFEGEDKQVMQDAYKRTKKELKKKQASSMSKLGPDDKFTLIAISLNAILSIETKRLIDESAA